ncbi:MAG: YdcF family protein [Candidatus Acidiferrales bacterium]
MTRRNTFRITAVVVLLALVLAGVFAFRGAGRWLIREDALRPAGVIVVLSGAMPERAEEAAHIFRMGYAHEVWLTHPVGPARELAEMGIHFMGEDDYSREVLIHEGVPDADIRILPDTIIDTEQEVDETARAMRNGHISTAIIVTSPPHTRRVGVLWRELAPRNLHVIVRAAYEDPFDANHWWRNTRDALSVTREMLGLLNAWAGLPVRPRAR